MNEPEDLIGWAHAASKGEIAALAIEVFGAAQAHDRVATTLLENAADILAEDAVACAARLARRQHSVQFVFAGSILLKQPAFARQVKRKIEKHWPKAVAGPLRRESAWGAIELAREVAGVAEASGREKEVAPAPETVNDKTTGLESLLQSPTEQRNPRSMNLDRMPLRKAIGLMLDEDAKIPRLCSGSVLPSNAPFS